jgi:peptidoglycan/LPS O-acetylase OafA/YrhL
MPYPQAPATNAGLGDTVQASIVAKRSHYPALDGLRGASAVTVMVLHVVVDIIVRAHGQGVDTLGSALRWLSLTPLAALWSGTPSVILFFVLSGFVLSTMLERQPMGYSAYVVRRMARLWLPYVVTLLAAAYCVRALGPVTLPGFDDGVNRFTTHRFDLASLMAHLTLVLPFASETYNFVVWSLAFEMRISLLFPAMHRAIRRRKAAPTLAVTGAVAVFSVVAAALAKRAGYSSQSQDVLLTPYYCLYFVVGALLERHWPSVAGWLAARSVASRVALIACATLLWTTMQTLPNQLSFHVPYLAHQVFCLPGSVLLIVYAMQPGPLQRGLCHPLAQYLGRISYSLYLVHAFVNVALLKLLVGHLPLLAIIALSLVSSFALAELSYRFIELPAIQLGRRWSVPRGRVEPAAGRA